MKRKGFILKKNIFSSFLEKLFTFPLWVKQVIYFHLFENLAESLSEDFINADKADIFHLHTPTLSFAGKAEMEERRANCEPNVYIFLTNVNEGLNFLEIAMNNFWTMEEVAQYYIFCLEQDYLKSASSEYVYAMAGFMSGKFRTGEYFKRVGKINVDQLEQTIVKQREYAEQGDPKKMAEIMIEQGFITNKDSHSLLIIKQESKKRFILDTEVVPENLGADIKSSEEYKEIIDKLHEQNKILKEQLKKLLAFVKQNG